MRSPLTLSIGIMAVALLLLGGGLFAGWHAGMSRIEHLEETSTTEREEMRVRLANLEDAMAGIAGATDDLRADLEARELIAQTQTESLRTAFEDQVAELSSSVVSQESRLTGLTDVADIAGLIDSWSRYVYDITCLFENAEGNTAKGSGSATLMYEGAEIVFVTNAHVVEEGAAQLIECDLVRPGIEDSITVDASDIEISEESDVAYGSIEGTYLAMTSADTCTEAPRIGERLITLGYPQIGAKNSITVTEGIISGFDDDYYATSAKIERGNSGGAAVSIERDCFLGLPTLVVAGRIESLARILPALSF